MKMFAKVHKFDRITVITHTIFFCCCWGVEGGGAGVWGGGGAAGGDCPGLIYISV